MLKLKLLILKLFFGWKKRRLLIILQNNNELRATGGFITKVIELKIGKLQIKKKFLDVFTDLAKNIRQDAPKAIKEMLNDNFYKGWTFRDANFDPDFNKSVKKLIEFYEKDVYALLAVNYSFIENLLGILGSVKVNDEKVTKENLFMFMSSNTADIDRHDLESIRARKNVIPALYKAIFKKTILSLHKWLAIYGLIKNSYKNKDLQLWEKGKKNPSNFDFKNANDFTAIIESNFLGGKSNRYIKRTVFRNININKNEANIDLSILWEHLGGFNHPLSTKYKSFVRIYLPKNAEINIDADITREEDCQIVEFEMEILPGEKGAFNLSYKLPGNFLNNSEYNFTYIKQSGVQDEFLTESYALPLQYSFKNTANAVIHENTCSIKNAVNQDINYDLPIYKTNYHPRLIQHDFIAHNKVRIKFNEPVEFKNDKINISISDKNSNKKFKISNTNFIGNNTILEIEIEGIPQEEEKFYIVELSNIQNKEGIPLKENPRKATVVYRSRYFV
jgi:hypothetical protein